MYSIYITLYQICKYEAREALSKFQAKKDVNKKKPVNSSGGGIGSGLRTKPDYYHPQRHPHRHPRRHPLCHPLCRPVYLAPAAPCTLAPPAPCTLGPGVKPPFVFVGVKPGTEAEQLGTIQGRP